MSMYPWHHRPAHAHAHSPPSHASTTATTTPAQYQMPRWLPSVMSRPQQQQQPQQGAPGNTLPTISSKLRMAQNSNHPPVSVAVESRAPPPPAPPAPESDGGSEMSETLDRAVLDAPGDPVYALPSEDAHGRRGPGTGAGGAAGLAIPTPTNDREVFDDSTNSVNMLGDTRKHGKRLTTYEEVSLFDICNRHAAEFGQRSNLCKWWITVTDEFTRDQGHPYSWHSVRRKVEMVTKQRMKVLEELREKSSGVGAVDGSGGGSGDVSNPRWRAAVDAWIPTWQRWEEAEAKRIEKRDSKKTRKRKSRTWESPWNGDDGAGGVTEDNWRTTPGSPVVEQSTTTTNTSPVVPSAIPAQNPASTVRLPPGFDSMFSNPNPNPSSQTSSQIRKITTSCSPYQPTPPASTSTPTSKAPTGPSLTENNMMSALLETLGKLNKNLESATPISTPPTATTTANPNTNPRSSPVVSAVVSSTTQQQDNTDNNNTSNSSDNGNSLNTLDLLKEELRREMREEVRRAIEKDRASLEDKLDSVQRTQEMILEMLRQEPA